MKRWLYRYERVHGDPETLDRILRRHVTSLLRAAADGADAAVAPDGALLLDLPAHVLGADVHKQVRVQTGVAARRERRTVIPLRWHADPASRVFPTFEGTVELEAQSRSTAHLTIAGAATLPLGPLGGAADTVALGSVAQSTISYLTEHLATALEHAVETPEQADADVSRPTERLRVRDVMTADPVTLPDDMPLRTAALVLLHYDITGAPVSEQDGGLVGVLSEADLLDVEAPDRHGMDDEVDASHRRWTARTVGEACSRPVHVVVADATVAQAAELMRDHRIGRLPVVDDAELVGIVTRHDVLRALLRTDAETEAAARRLLDDLDERGITVAVEWGIAHLEGVASRRSRVRSVVARMRDIDGIIGVEEDLAWDRNDIVPGATQPGATQPGSRAAT